MAAADGSVDGGGMPVMAITDVAQGIRWQADHAERAGAPCTARVVRGTLALLSGATETGRRMAAWQGRVVEDALPLRVAGGLHSLFLMGEGDELAPVYSGQVTEQASVDAIVARVAERHDDKLLPWLDSPPQTNEAGRSASIMGGLLWLSARLGPRFELNEIGASAGINTMMARYFYDLGGVQAGPEGSMMRIVPQWRGPPPPQAQVAIVSAKGCDVAPLDLADPEQVLRLKAYIWADARERMVRMDAAARLAAEARPDLVRMDAEEFVARQLAAPQQEGVTRVLFNTVMWQYLPDATRQAISGMMDEAGGRASPEAPLAWLALETNRATFRHELRARYWPGGEDPALLAEAHPHGAWVTWLDGGD